MGSDHDGNEDEVDCFSDSKNEAWLAQACRYYVQLPSSNKSM